MGAGEGITRHSRGISRASSGLSPWLLTGPGPKETAVWGMKGRQGSLSSQTRCLLWFQSLGTHSSGLWAGPWSLHSFPG